MRRFLIPAITGIALAGAIGSADIRGTAAQEIKQIRWATSAVGSAGHRALVALMATLNREMPDYSITVLPTPGAIATVRGYATEQFDGFYGADIAFQELAGNTARFKGFRDQMKREPVQSFWAYTIEVGLGVRADDAAKYKGWSGLSGSGVFTGPAPWDVRAQLERAMATLDVGHNYVELDLGLAGSSLAEGTIDGFIIYTTGEANPAPWVNEAMLSTKVAALNPTTEEVEKLQAAGLEVVDVPASVFQTEVGTDSVKLVPFFYGFHVGLEMPEDDVYRMLTLIEKHADELAKVDSAFNQIAKDMVGMQRRGIAASLGTVKIHPGLARFLREKGAWDDAWNEHVAG